jgi:hypothetical protein
MVRTVTRRCLTELAQNQERSRMPADPVLLMGKNPNSHTVIDQPSDHTDGQPIVTHINGKTVTFTS